jgi:hypothetical protein
MPSQYCSLPVTSLMLCGSSTAGGCAGVVAMMWIASGSVGSSGGFSGIDAGA